MVYNRYTEMHTANRIVVSTENSTFLTSRLFGQVPRRTWASDFRPTTGPQCLCQQRDSLVTYSMVKSLALTLEALSGTSESGVIAPVATARLVSRWKIVAVSAVILAAGAFALLRMRPAAGQLGPLSPVFALTARKATSPFRGFSLAPDGKSFLTSIYRAKSDIWLLELQE